MPTPKKTKTTAKPAPKATSAVVQPAAPAKCQKVEILWPFWLKMSLFIITAYSGLMILSFGVTLYAMLTRPQLVGF